MSESIPVVLKRRTECPMCQNDWHVTESLRAERDTARGEAEDFRRAWAILRENENQRMPATAEEGARQFRAEFDTVRADLEKAHEEIKRLSIEALKAGNRAHNENAEVRRELEKARAALRQVYAHHLKHECHGAAGYETPDRCVCADMEDVWPIIGHQQPGPPTSERARTDGTSECTCPSPALHSALAEGRPIDPTKCVACAALSETP